MTRDLVALLGGEHVQGGREDGRRDCLGVTLEALRRYGVAEALIPDPWERVAELYACDPDAVDADSLFPPGWRAAAVGPVAPALPGLAIFSAPGRGGACRHVGAVLEGRLWSSRRGAGCYAVDWARAWRDVSQLWILDPPQ